MTNLVQAEVDGESLTDNEIGAFFVLLSVAGNDTTRNTIAHSMRRLTEHPDQRAWLAEDHEGRTNSSRRSSSRTISAGAPRRGIVTVPSGR